MYIFLQAKKQPEYLSVPESTLLTFVNYDDINEL